MSSCVSTYTQKSPNLRGGFHTTPDEHSLTPPLCRWSPLIALRTPPCFSSFSAACVTGCCSARPASWSTPYVLPEKRIVVNIMYIRRLCDHVKVLHIFDQTWIGLKSGCSSTMALLNHLSCSPVSVSPTDAPSGRWPALTTLPTLAKFKLVWCRLCETLWSCSLAGQKHPSRLSCLVGNVGNIKFVFAWTWIFNRVLYLRTTQCTRSQRRSQFEHDHRRRADRAPQVAASFTRDIAWGKLGPDRTGARNGHESAVRVQAWVSAYRRDNPVS